MTPFQQLLTLLAVAVATELVTGALVGHYYHDRGFKAGYEHGYDKGHEHGLWGRRHKNAKPNNP